MYIFDMCESYFFHELFSFIAFDKTCLKMFFSDTFVKRLFIISDRFFLNIRRWSNCSLAELLVLLG